MKFRMRSLPYLLEAFLCYELDPWISAMPIQAPHTLLATQLESMAFPYIQNYLWQVILILQIPKALSWQMASILPLETKLTYDCR